MWKVIGVDDDRINVRILIRGARLSCILCRCQTSIFGGVDGEKRVEWIIVIVLLDTVTVEAFYIKQTAV